MPDVITVVSGFVPGAPRLSVPFATFLLLHVPAGLTAVITGAIAAVSKKRRGRHPRFGTIYYWALAVVFISATGMAMLRWTEDRHLFALGTISFGIASVGYLARKVRWNGALLTFPWVGSNSRRTDDGGHAERRRDAR